MASWPQNNKLIILHCNFESTLIINRCLEEVIIVLGTPKEKFVWRTLREQENQERMLQKK